MTGIVECTKYITVSKNQNRYDSMYGNQVLPLLKAVEFFNIDVVTTPCNYGGERIWLICPFCGKKTLTLFFSFWHFKCRKCADLLYEKQRLSKIDRALHYELVEPVLLLRKIRTTQSRYKGKFTRKWLLLKKKWERLEFSKEFPWCSVS